MSVVCWFGFGFFPVNSGGDEYVVASPFLTRWKFGFHRGM